MKLTKLSLLSRLWLSEPDSSTLEEASGLPDLAGLAGTVEEMAAAFTGLFLLNVYPYASVFLDPNGEMNGERARELIEIYRRYDYSPEVLTQAGAPDHIGLLLDFLAHLPEDEIAPTIVRYALDWVPALCLSIEREPGAHPFYNSLASITRRELFLSIDYSNVIVEKQAASDQHGSDPDFELPLLHENEEFSLNQLVHHLLCPASSGIFISRDRLGLWARELGVPLAFGERFRLGVSLFEAAGMVDRVSDLQSWITAELDAWEEAYAAWSADFPFFSRIVAAGRERLIETRRLISMKYSEPNIVN